MEVMIPQCTAERENANAQILWVQQAKVKTGSTDSLTLAVSSSQVQMKIQTWHTTLFTEVRKINSKLKPPSNLCLLCIVKTHKILTGSSLSTSITDGYLLMSQQRNNKTRGGDRTTEAETACRDQEGKKCQWWGERWWGRRQEELVDSCWSVYFEGITLLQMFSST